MYVNGLLKRLYMHGFFSMKKDENKELQDIWK